MRKSSLNFAVGMRWLCLRGQIGLARAIDKIRSLNLDELGTKYIVRNVIKWHCSDTYVAQIQIQSKLRLHVHPNYGRIDLQ